MKSEQAETKEMGDQLRGLCIYPGDRLVAGASGSSEYILKVGPIRFSDGLDKGCEEKKDAWVFGLSTWRIGVIID